MNTDLIEASEACCSLDVLASFMTSGMSHHCALGVILVGQPLLGRFTTGPNFLHLWIMTLTRDDSRVSGYPETKPKNVSEYMGCT